MSLSWNTAAAWLLHSAVGGGLLLLLTCLLIRRTRQPARRQRLGELGLAAALVLALLSLRPPWLVVAYPVSAPAGSRAAVAPPAVVEEELVFAWVDPADGARPARDLGPAPVEVPRPPVSPPASPTRLSMLAAVLPWLVLAHALGAAFLLVRWLLGHVALARLLRGATAAPAEVTRLFEAMAPGPRRPRLLVARRLRVPLSCGLLRPTVVLPAALCVTPDLQKLRWSFAHELTHLERRDAWSAVLFALGQAVYFFLPWFGWLRRQVRLCQEYVADAAAAGQDEPAVDYAEFLLSLTGAPAVPAAASGVSGNCSDLYRRVSMLLKEPLRVEKRCPRRWSLTVAAALFAFAVLVGGVGLRADAAPQVVIIIPGQADADKQAKPEEARKVRVVIVPGPGHAPKAAPLQTEMKFKLKLDPHLDGLHKMLERLKQQQGAAGGKAAREVIVQFLAQLPEKKALRVVQEGEKLIVLQKKAGESKPGKDAEAALGALRKALEALKQQPELESARKELQKAIEQLERARPHALRFLAPPAGVRLLLDNSTWMTTMMQLHPQAEALRLRSRVADPTFFTPAGTAKPINPEVLKQVREELRKQNYGKAEELLKKALEATQPKMLQFHLWHDGGDFLMKARQAQVQRPQARIWLNEMYFDLPAPSLGVGVEKPSAALADQLNLPRDRGLIVTSVKPNSPAARAGLKINDVLLELNGRPVPSDAARLAQALKAIKAGEAITVVVLRKGKQETIRGIRLAGGGVTVQRLGQLAIPVDPFGKQLAGPGQKDVMTTMLRKGDRFTTRYQEGSLIITLTGTVAGGKARVGEINVQDGQQSSHYDSVERVPAKYRDKVNHLVEISGRGEMHIEGK